MEPAHSIIEALGGPTEVARITGAHRTRVSNWKRPRDAGGTGGVIPFKYARKLLSAAQEKGIELKLEAFLPFEEAAQ